MRSLPVGILCAAAASLGVVGLAGAGVGRWEPAGGPRADGKYLLVRAIAVKPRDPSVVYAGVDSRGLYKTTDGGRTWRSVLAEATGATNVRSVSIDPKRPKTVYVGAHGAENGVLKTVDGGLTWELVGPDLRYPEAFAFDPRDSDVVYAGTEDGLFKTVDGGRTWVSIGGRAKGAPARAVSAVAVSARNGAVVYMGAREAGVFKSTNGGRTWRAVNTGLMDRHVTALAIDPVRPETLYLGAFDAGLFKSTDGARTWRPLSAPRGLPGWGWVAAGSIVVDPRDHRTVYVGGSRGVLVSRDAGETWSRLAAGLRSRDPSDLAVDARTRVLYAGTFCCGVYVHRLARGSQ